MVTTDFPSFEVRKLLNCEEGGWESFRGLVSEIEKIQNNPDMLRLFQKLEIRDFFYLKESDLEKALPLLPWKDFFVSLMLLPQRKFLQEETEYLIQHGAVYRDDTNTYAWKVEDFTLTIYNYLCSPSSAMIEGRNVDLVYFGLLEETFLYLIRSEHQI